MSDQTRDPKESGVTTQARSQLITQSVRALDVINDLCQGRRRWVMSVPARPDEDPDLVLASAIRALTEANAADAQTIATLRAKVERSGDALAIERGLVTIYRNDVERHAQTIAALRDENARLKAVIAATFSEEGTPQDIIAMAVRIIEHPDAARLLSHVCRMSERCERARAELATLKADADRREQEALREGFMARGHAVGTISNGYGWRFDVPPTASPNEELKFAAYLTQRQEQPKP